MPNSIPFFMTRYDCSLHCIKLDREYSWAAERTVVGVLDGVRGKILLARVGFFE